MVTEMLRTTKKAEPIDIKNKCNKTLQKKITIKEQPNILVVHLKRFTNDNHKINDSIGFKTPTSYKLSAICNHSGHTRGGHYTAAVLRGHGGWQMCNDIHTQELPQLPEKSNLPYILFFEKYKRKISDIK